MWPGRPGLDQMVDPVDQIVDALALAPANSGLLGAVDGWPVVCWTSRPEA